jgi:hypothetical protein
MSRSNHGGNGGHGGKGGHGGNGNHGDNGGHGNNGGNGGHGNNGGHGGNDNHGNNCSPHNSPPPSQGNNCPPQNNDGGDSHKAALISARADVDLDASASLFKGCNLLDVQAGLDADVGLDIGYDSWHA